MSHLKSQFEEVRLVYKNKVRASERPKIQSPKEAFDVFHKTWDSDTIGLIEEAKVLLLDNQLRLMSLADISKGGMSEAIVDPRVIFSLALKRRSHKIILAHNHPSGILNPSRADIKLTERLSDLGKMMRIDLEDHLIVTQEGYRSIMNDTIGTLGNG